MNTDEGWRSYADEMPAHDRVIERRAESGGAAPETTGAVMHLFLAVYGPPRGTWRYASDDLCRRYAAEQSRCEAAARGACGSAA